MMRMVTTVLTLLPSAAANPLSVATLKHDVLQHLFEHRGNRPLDDHVTLLAAEVL